MTNYDSGHCVSNSRRESAALIDQLTTENERLRGALEAVEYVGPYSLCPWCGYGAGGHAPNCKRQLALGR